MRRPRLIALAALVVGLAGCDVPSFGAPEPRSEQGESIFSLWQGFFLGALFVAALVWGLILFVVIRYRRRSDEVPDQRAFHIPLEVFYTVVPILAVGVLYGFSWATQIEVTDTDPEPVATIDVIGFQWSWQFDYTDDDVLVTGEPGAGPEMVIPVGRPVRLHLVAADVNHSFWVPDFLSKRDLIPGVDNDIEVTPTETGTYVGRCAEYCGLDHWRMNFSVRVVEQDEYDDWLADQRRAQADEPDVRVDEDADTVESEGSRT